MDSIEEDDLNRILQGSQSSNIYNELNRSVSGGQYDEYCKSLNGTEKNIPNENYNLCKLIARNAEDLSKKYNTPRYTNQCLHNRYWVYYELRKVLKKISKTEELKSLSDNFLEASNSINRAYNAYNCLYAFENDIFEGLKDKVEEKYLHDYFTNFDSIKTSDACERVQLNKYTQYLNYIITLYNKRIAQDSCCHGSFLIDCVDYFNCNDEFDPSKLLSSLNKNGINKCSNLEKAEAPANMDSISSFQNSRSHIFNSFYIVTCKGNDNLICKMSPSYESPKNFNSNTNHRLQSDFNSLVSRSRAVQSVEISDEQQKRSSNLSGLSSNSDQKSTLREAPNSLSLSENGKSNVQKICPGYQFGEGSPGLCEEPNVRERGTLGGRWEEYSPHKKVRYTRSIKGFYSNTLVNKTDTITNNFFRVGVALALAIGIIFTIFLYYKFTPFGRRLRKKTSRNKRIDDDVDISYLRQFKIRAPKTVNRNRGSTRLQFAYYSR
ncbi:PIR Superfamily Protein [Plasmodium malariae]|uniref:PIR Superfamily Protein n=1 Tax=Plasmodium malariae TaxID=5858 RepID=A0A1A8X609_PLAMA|nr:PIR Superfamily Protein [Plasmodium malariae]